MAGMQLVGAALFIEDLHDTTRQWRSDAVWAIGSPASYADDQEFGTAYQSGTPHLRPAVRATEAAMAEIAMDADGMDDYLRRIAFHIETGTKRRAPVLTGYLRSSYAAEQIK